MSEPIPFSNELLAELQAEEPDCDNIRQYIIRMYNEDTGSSLEEDVSPTDERLSDVVGWMNHRLMESDDSVLFFRRERILLKLFFSSLSDKAGSLSQYHCPICKRRREGPWIVIPIRMPPISVQSRTSKNSKSELKRAFVRAMKSRFTGPIL